MTKFSIIIPAHNAGGLIERCIKSVLKNNYKAYEIIIVENGSTDDTQNICKKILQLSSAIRIYSIGPSTASGARNYGISKADGDYILFVDADDEISPNLLDKLNEIIKKEKPEFIRFTGKKEENGMLCQIDNNSVCSEVFINKDKFFEILLGSKPIATYVWLLAVKRDAIKKCFDEDLCYLEDLLFYIENIQEGLLYINVDGYTYHYNRGSVTKNPQNYKETVKAIMTVRRIMIEKGYDRKKVDRWCLNLVVFRIRTYACCAQRKEAKNMFRWIKNRLIEEEITKKTLPYGIGNIIVYSLLKVNFYNMIVLLCNTKRCAIKKRGGKK